MYGELVESLAAGADSVRLRKAPSSYPFVDSRTRGRWNGVHRLHTFNFQNHDFGRSLQFLCRTLMAIVVVNGRVSALLLSCCEVHASALANHA